MQKAKHGGARPGAGRKRKSPALIGTATPDGNQVDAMTFLQRCINDKALDAALRIRAAGLVLASGRRGKVVAREEAEAERLAGFDPDQPWQDRLMAELTHEKNTTH